MLNDDSQIMIVVNDSQKSVNNPKVHQLMNEYTKCGIFTLEDYLTIKQNEVLKCYKTDESQKHYPQ